MDYQQINQEIGQVDLYLLDHILKGRFQHPMRILDAGCGEGRNMAYFLKNNFDIYGIDQDEDTIRVMSFLTKNINPLFDAATHLQVGSLDALPYEDGFFDAVICSAVLHFARDTGHFHQMMAELCRVWNGNGPLFIRTATNIGMENEVEKREDGLWNLPDKSIRYLLTKETLDQEMSFQNLYLLDHLKVVLVEDKRAMSSLIFSKGR